MILFYITCKDEKEARKVAKHLLEKKMVACANYFPIKSVYRWKGKFVDGKEFALILKTMGKNKEEVEAEVKKVHSYEVPCILFFSISANKDFEAWVRKEVK